MKFTVVFTATGERRQLTWEQINKVIRDETVAYEVLNTKGECVFRRSYDSAAEELI